MPRTGSLDPISCLSPRTPRAPRFKSAFTIVEIIVVVVIIAVLAGTVMPRLGNVSLRHAENEAKAVRALLTSIAQRDAMSSQAYALAYDPESSRLGLLTLVESGVAGEPAQWAPAPAQSPLTCAYTALSGAAADGQNLDGAWKIEFRPGMPRPAVSLLLVMRDSPDERGWQVDLGSGQLVATIAGLPSGGAWQPRDRAADDLDAKGMRETPW